MRYHTFILFNVLGGVLWASGIVYLGSLFGGVEFVRNNIDAIFLGIVAFSIVPMLFGLIQKARSERKQSPAPATIEE